MSRIGRMPIAIPAGVEVKIDGHVVTVKGAKATLTREIHPNITVAVEGNEILVNRPNDDKHNRALHGLTKRGITLLVRTCDPNVTEELICSVYELDPYYVEVLGATAGRSYSNLVKGCEPESEAVLASNGRLEGMADSLARCSRLRTGAVLAVVLQVVGGVLGLVLGIYLAFRSGQPFPPLYSLAYLMGWAVLTWMVPVLLRKS